MSRARSLVPIAVALVAMSQASAHVAQAQTVDESRSRADALFNEGQQLLSAGQLVAACAKLEESQRVDPKLGRLLNVAYCHERVGRIATAWSEYNQAAAVAMQSRQSDREAFAHGRAAELAAKLSFVRLDVPAGSELAQVTIDGRALTREQWTVPFPIDPGSHTLTFDAPGRQTQTETVKVADAETVRVVVAPFQPAEASPTPPPSPAPPAPVAAPVSPPPAEAPTSQGGSRVPGWIVGGVGVVGLGVGAAFAIDSLSLKHQADSECLNKQCTSHGMSLISDATTAANIATASLVVGTVGVAVGTWLIIHPLHLSGGSSARLAPYVASDRAGVALDGAW